jgi:hypothetical protein
LPKKSLRNWLIYRSATRLSLLPVVGKSIDLRYCREFRKSLE